MPLVTFEDDSHTPANDRIRPSASWQDKRAERVHKLEAELAASIARRKTDSHKPLEEPDYGSILDSEHGESRSSDTCSENSSLFYSEGQPLLCTYQPPDYPGSSANYGAVDRVVKSPEQYLPWRQRLVNTLGAICVPCCAEPDH
ncbi:hypothetical protein LPJ78_001879 [Coemansia sp. RSA 989]|nr:hypothetical protein LPJ78_001879 [Coemansia sp. RSA 989]